MTIAGSRHFSKLVQDYLTAFDTSPIREFFALSPFDRGAGLQTLAQELVQRASSETAQKNRQTLVEEIRKQHEATDTLSNEVKANLELLGKPTTLAVVTGQQVGILGGPLYTLYKAFSAVALARELNTLLDGYNVVPIFWQETEDHDLDEAAHYGILDQNINFVDITYVFAEEAKRRQAGSITLDAESLNSFFSNLESSVQRTEFTDGTIALYKQFYREGRTLSNSQARFLAHFSQGDGLLILNANTRSLKGIGKKIFGKELSNPTKLQEAVTAQTGKLSASYHAQIEPSAVNLFIIENEKRFKIETDGDGFRYNDKKISRNELLDIFEREPERISPNVLMRPLYQDTLLPTVAYIGGPGEIAYFAQIRAAYEWAGIPMPLIAPRFSATIVEDKARKPLDKVGAGLEEFIEHGQSMVNSLTATAEESSITNLFDEAGKKIEATIEGLRATVVKADGSLDGALTSLKGKLLSPLKDLASKTLSAEKKKSLTLRSQLEKTLTALLPKGGLQERKLGAFYFINKYGPRFIEGMKNNIKQAPAQGHNLVNISEILE